MSFRWSENFAYAAGLLAEQGPWADIPGYDPVTVDALGAVGGDGTRALAENVLTALTWNQPWSVTVVATVPWADGGVGETFILEIGGLVVSCGRSPGCTETQVWASMSAADGSLVQGTIAGGPDVTATIACDGVKVTLTLNGTQLGSFLLPEKVNDDVLLHCEILGVVAHLQSVTVAEVVAEVSESSDAYLTVAQAAALAATLPGLTRFLAKDAATQAGLLLLASIDVDASGRWQGGKYDPAGTIGGTVQVREFPRWIGVSSCQCQVSSTRNLTLDTGNSSVLDWDPVNNVAVVPTDVKIAVLYQCEWLCQPAYAARLEAIKSGLASQAIGTGSESYAAAGVSDGLCDRASRLLEKYRLSTGRIL